MTKLIKPLRFFFRFIVPACFTVVLALKILSSPGIEIIPVSLVDSLDILYKILLSSIVGYYTNFLAITMLFKPKNRTRHGLQGLVPANQEELAEKLGDGISDNFFNAKDLISYINKNQLISSSVSGLKKTIEINLDQPENQKAITHWILETFRKNSPRIVVVLMQFSEINLSNYLRERIDLEALMKELTKVLEKNIKDGTIDLKSISRKLTDFIHENVPELSDAVYKQVNKAIERQSPLKRNILKFASWSFDFDQVMIEDYMYEMVSSEDFRQKMYRNVSIGLKQLTEYVQSERGTQQFNVYYHKLVIELNEKIKEKVVPFLMLEIEKFLQKKESWQKIESYLKTGLNFLEKTMEDLVTDERFDRFLSRSMPKIMDKIKVSSIVMEKVREYDTDKLEKMIMSASGEHLNAIEVLGGVLGAFAGVALFDPILFLMILGPLSLLGLVEFLVTVRYRKKQRLNIKN